MGTLGWRIRLVDNRMADEDQFPGITGAAVLFVDRQSESIRDCNAAATSMLGQPQAQLAGRSWWDVLGISPSPELPLTRAVRSGVRTMLPPMLLYPPKRGEMVAGGYVFSQLQQGREVLVLLLFQLGCDSDSVFQQPVGPNDVVAVLGLDSPAEGPPRASDDTARRMVDIRFGLQQIVPCSEDVGLPAGATIPVVLRDLTLDQGRDIARALLSHLTSFIGKEDRIRVGLAQCGHEASSLATLVAANNALLRLQRASSGDMIATAGEWDEQWLGVNVAGAEGILGQGPAAQPSLAFLSALAALEPDPHHADDYLAKVLALTLQQRAVDAVGIYRRRFDDSYEYVCGGMAHAAADDSHTVSEKQLPRTLSQLARKTGTGQLQSQHRVEQAKSSCTVLPLRLYERVLGFMVLQYDDTAREYRFAPDTSSLHLLSRQIATMTEWREAVGEPPRVQPVATRQAEDRIDGYVGDNMEGAIDQAVFLSRLDIPVAIIGPRGTGKLYVAKVIHQESGAAMDKMVAIDCREFRGRKDALNRVARELERSRGKTLVFKSPHLMNPDAQLKLARQISSRILADTSPPRYLPAARIIALFPDSLEHLVRYGGLNERLASVFAAYPIRVPPIKDRKRAVLRWAHKILTQEASRRDRRVSGFTPDAEQAMLQHDWPGNISEMRQCIVAALDKTDKEWLTPVDLGMFKGLSPAGRSEQPQKRAYLQVLIEAPQEEEAYAPTTLEELGVALGEALHALLELDTIKPLGAWLDDEVILAVCERYRDNMRAAADFLQTKPRNIGRWMPKVLSRDHERSSSSLWQTPQRLIRQWIREAAAMDEPPQQLVQATLLHHVVSQCGGISVADRARIMGVSTPTYQKRLQEIQAH